MAGPPRHYFSSQENGRGYNPGELSHARAFSFTYKKETQITPILTKFSFCSVN